ncbi:2OG-Fe(II) oxygenase [Methylocella silvestris BL2]|uniref:2OG-Fe(II) oxygenase n=1 Tax=Methylocella silvestris (strain DSM 15510 / CIP 108128 / LMG 27833 / NCIMB 13906 / BL2) TaxID=395965 RepID=B8EML3_METSB|nr:alpha-ketoglutarate-dependent dioxygenase AlkB [Methylocella silvestris]ACK52692.1 2OG-Fe(II) oxygenase [Methylocella silvestris BL2]
MTKDLFAALEPSVELAPGLVLARGFFDGSAQRLLADEIAALASVSPWYRPRMPRSGKPFSVEMTNCGTLGWVSDIGGYRYQPLHPVTGEPWRPIPALALRAWGVFSAYPLPPQACLVNFYGAEARMGLHQDADEGDFSAPVVSISLGDEALFRYGGQNRSDPTRSVRLRSGDVIVLGGPSRRAFHGVDRIFPGTSELLQGGGRINLTLRRVTGRGQ